MVIDWGRAIRYGRLVEVAEDVAPAGQYDATAIARIQALGYAPVGTIYGLDGQFGFTAISPEDELVVVLRGTATPLEWFEDGRCALKRYIAGSVAFGFQRVYHSLRSGNGLLIEHACSLPCKFLTVCGHSLGGALATLTALDLSRAGKRVSLYSFASPRVGDHIFADSFNLAVPESHRVVNPRDEVPKLPPPFPLPYEHVAGEGVLDCGDDAPRGAAGEHHISTYLLLMQRKVESQCSTK